jgi:hypothetical protein
VKIAIIVFQSNCTNLLFTITKRREATGYAYAGGSFTTDAYLGALGDTGDGYGYGYAAGYASLYDATSGSLNGSTGSLA